MGCRSKGSSARVLKLFAVANCEETAPCVGELVRLLNVLLYSVAGVDELYARTSILKRIKLRVMQRGIPLATIILVQTAGTGPERITSTKDEYICRTSVAEVLGLACLQER